MKIIISSKHFLPTLGGSINYAVMLAEAFLRKGEEVIIMTRTPASKEPFDGCEVVRIPGVGRRFELAGWADAILQVDASWGDVWPFLLRGVPWFPTIHCGKILIEPTIKARISLLGLQIAYQLGRTIPVGDQVAKEWHIKGKPIHNPFDDQIFFPPSAGSARNIDLLFVGRIERSKGVFILVEALKQIVPRLAGPLRCCIVGDGVDDGLLRKATADFGAGVHFEHTGRLSSVEVAERMRNSSILVFPTTPEWIEASPLTPLEALACGCRIIAADNGGTRENIGPQGRLIASGSVESLIEALGDFLLVPEGVREEVELEKFLATRHLDFVAELYLQRLSKAVKN